MHLPSADCNMSSTTWYNSVLTEVIDIFNLSADINCVQVAASASRLTSLQLTLWGLTVVPPLQFGLNLNKNCAKEYLHVVNRV